MFAKANPSMKEKLFQIVLSVLAWRQRIAEARPEKLERAIHYGARIGVLRRPGLCQLAHSRTNRWRKIECFPPFARRQFVASGFGSRKAVMSAHLCACLWTPVILVSLGGR